MSRYENILKLKEIRRLVDSRQYKKAFIIMDTLDLNRFKGIAELNIFAEIYIQNGKYDDAMDTLLRVYEKSATRRVLYQLVELSIKCKSMEDAEQFFDEYCEIAPSTPNKYILRYKIDKFKGAATSTLINSLEKLKECEYDEKWAFELAKQYYKAGYIDKCIRECNDIILWFGSGIFVEKAQQLRDYCTDDGNTVNITKSQDGKLDEKDKKRINNKDVTAFIEEDTESFEDDLAYHPNEDTEDTSQSEEESKEAVHKEKLFADDENLSKNNKKIIPLDEGDIASEDEDNTVPEDEVNTVPEDEENTVSEDEDNTVPEDHENTVLEDEENTVSEDDDMDFLRNLLANDVKYVETTFEEKEVYNSLEVNNPSKNIVASKQLDITETDIQSELKNAMDTVGKDESVDRVIDTKMQTRTKAEKKIQVQEVAQTEVQTEIQKKTQREQHLEPQSKVQTEPQTKVQTEPQTKIQSETQMESQIKVQMEPQIKEQSEPQTKVQTKSQLELRPKEQTQPQIKEQTEIQNEIDDQMETTDIVYEQEEIIINGVNLNKIFGDFFCIETVKKEISRSINNILYGENKRKLFLITGYKTSGKTELGKMLSRSLYKLGVVKKSNIAKITASKLNQIELKAKKTILLDGVLIIENASELLEKTVRDIIDLINDAEERITIILEDSKNQMNILLSQNSDLKSYVSNSIDIPAYNKEYLMCFSYQYLKKKEYDLDDEAKDILIDLAEKISDECEYDSRLKTMIECLDYAISKAESRNESILKNMIKKGIFKEQINLLKASDFFED